MKPLSLDEFKRRVQFEIDTYNNYAEENELEKIEMDEDFVLMFYLCSAAMTKYEIEQYEKLRKNQRAKRILTPN